MTMRVTTLDGDLGDPKALPGTRGWAAQLRTELQSGLHDLEFDATHLDVLASIVEEDQAYRLLQDQDGNDFPTYEAFCLHRRPFGLGYKKTDLERIVIERKMLQKTAKEYAAEVLELPPVLKLHGGDRYTQPQETQDSIRILSPKGGTNVEYITARLRRDRPDILEKIVSGEITSMNQAAILAGFKPKSLMIYVDPPRIARTLRKHLTHEEVLQVIELLSD
jgi:hypothetical protein